MKKRVWLLGLMILLCAVTSLAQDQQESSTQENPSSNEPETPPKHKRASIPTPQWELSGGYNYRRYSVSSGAKLDLNGWFGSADYNVFRNWLGVTGELSGVYDDQGINGFTSLYSLMAGPQLYPFRHHRITPFAHVLVGEGYIRITFPAYGGYPAFARSDTAHTWQAGGGIDLEHWEHWGIRLVEIDYGNTSFFTAATHMGESNIRAYFGLTYRWGEKK
jgi:hypothetical protein